MLPSWRLARNWLAGKPGRLALMIGAVALASALVVAVSCAVASVQKSMEQGITSFLGAADARVIHQFNGRFDSALLEKVRSWPEVERATARLGSSLTLAHADHRRDDKDEIIRATPFAVGVDFAQEETFRKWKWVQGGRPQKPDEIALDPMAADELHAKVGERWRSSVSASRSRSRWPVSSIARGFRPCSARSSRSIGTCWKTRPACRIS